MADKVYVTWAQRAAAREIIRRDEARGRITKPYIVRMANAQPDNEGRYVAPADQAS